MAGKAQERELWGGRMSRLIDAEKLISKIKNVATGCWLNHVKTNAEGMWNDVQDVINEQPTIDQWHYPSKGEYPKEDEDVVVLVKAGKKMLKGIGVYINQEWAIRHREEMWLIEPYAWQNIIPPQEEV